VRLSGYDLFTVSSYTSETTAGGWGDGEVEEERRGDATDGRLTALKA